MKPDVWEIFPAALIVSQQVGSSAVGTSNRQTSFETCKCLQFSSALSEANKMYLPSDPFHMITTGGEGQFNWDKPKHYWYNGSSVSDYNYNGEGSLRYRHLALHLPYLHASQPAKTSILIWLWTILTSERM